MRPQGKEVHQTSGIARNPTRIVDGHWKVLPRNLKRESSLNVSFM
jgi:hypothetical protein